MPLKQNNESKLKKHERLIIISASMLNSINKNKLSKSTVIFKTSNVTITSYSGAISHVIQSKIETRFEANFKVDIILIYQGIFVKCYQYSEICKSYDICQESCQTRRVFFRTLCLKRFPPEEYAFHS